MSARHSPRFLAAVEGAKARIDEMDVAGTLAGLAGDAPPVLVDVREAHEWARGHAAGAVQFKLTRQIRFIKDRDLQFVACAQLILARSGGNERGQQDDED